MNFGKGPNYYLRSSVVLIFLILSGDTYNQKWINSYSCRYIMAITYVRLQLMIEKNQVSIDSVLNSFRQLIKCKSIGCWLTVSVKTRLSVCPPLAPKMNLATYTDPKLLELLKSLVTRVCRDDGYSSSSFDCSVFLFPPQCETSVYLFYNPILFCQ